MRSEIFSLLFSGHLSTSPRFENNPLTVVNAGEVRESFPDRLSEKSKKSLKQNF